MPRKQLRKGPRQCQQAKSPEDVWRLVKQVAAEIDRRGGLNQNEEDRLLAAKAYRGRLSQDEEDRLLAAKAYVQHTTAPLNRLDKYGSFIVQLQEECKSTMQLLYIAVIRKTWLYYMHIANIPKLVEYLINKQAALSFKSNVLADLAVAYLPQENEARARRDKSVDATAATPDATHTAGQERTEENPGNATPTDPDATHTSEQETLGHYPAITTRPRSPGTHLVPGQEFSVVWSLRGINACLESGLIDCMINMPLGLSTANHLAQALSGIAVRSIDDRPSLPDTQERTIYRCEGGGEGIWQRFTCDTIAKALGKTLRAYVDAAPGRHEELRHGMQQYTDAVSVSTSREYPSLSIAVGTSAATKIRECLESPI